MSGTRLVLILLACICLALWCSLRNPWLRSRSLRSLGLAVLAIVLSLSKVSSEWQHISAAIATIDFLTLILFNSVTRDRVSERIPEILQDAVLVFCVVCLAAFLLRSQMGIPSALVALVVGVALQDTLGNFIAGLALQMERPFLVGHWIAVGPVEGEVVEVTWRSTRIRTRIGNVTAVPNQLVSKDKTVNYSEAGACHRVEVKVGLAFEVSPSQAQACLREAVVDAKGVLAHPEPVVLVADFADSWVEYSVRFWIEDIRLDDVIRSRVRLGIWYSLRRAGWDFPFPVSLESAPPRKVEGPTEKGRVVGSLPGLLSELPEIHREELLQCSTPLLFAPDEQILQEGTPGSSMYLVLSGKVRVLKKNSTFRADLEAGDFFGELSFLTGKPRSARVEAIGECLLLEFEAQRLRPILHRNPELLEALSQTGARRAKELLAAELETSPSSPNAAPNLVGRIRDFLRGL